MFTIYKYIYIYSNFSRFFHNNNLVVHDPTSIRLSKKDESIKNHKLMHTTMKLRDGFTKIFSTSGVAVWLFWRLSQLCFPSVVSLNASLLHWYDLLHMQVAVVVLFYSGFWLHHQPTITRSRAVLVELVGVAPLPSTGNSFGVPRSFISSWLLFWCKGFHN